jgi:hypothetical protein
MLRAFSNLNARKIYGLNRIDFEEHGRPWQGEEWEGLQVQARAV